MQDGAYKPMRQKIFMSWGAVQGLRMPRSARNRQSGVGVHPSSGAGHGKNALLVSDLAMLRMMIGDLLVSSGPWVLAALDADE